MHKIITSVQNPVIKNILQLQEKSRARKQSNSFVVEGQRELKLALEGGYQIFQLLYDADIINSAIIESEFVAKNFIQVSKDVYQKIAYRNSTEGVLAVVMGKNSSLEELQFINKSPLVLVAEAPEKPGNIGALLRTADAANVDAVLIANPKTDMYNPNIIRSSVGCLFTVPFATGSTTEILDFLKKNNIATYAAALKEDSTTYDGHDFTQATAIVVGTEADGLSDEWLNLADHKIIIPMLGKIDSMNVSVAAGILIYEAKRQRKFN